MAFSPDGTILATGSHDRTIRLWSTQTGRQLAVIKGHGSVVQALTWSPDGKYLISGSGDATVAMWDVTASQESELAQPPERKAYLTTAFAPSGELLAVGRTTNEAIKIWNLSQRRVAADLNESEGNVVYAAFSPQTDLLATGGTDKLVKIWNPQTDELIRAMPGHADSVYALEFSPDGRLLVSGGRDHSLIFWDTTDGRIVARLRGSLAHV